MPQIKPEVESFARIKVIGIGGSGKNTINHMINCKVKGVDFIAVNTDAQDLHQSLAKKRIHIGKNLTRGLGTGMNPELGKRAVEETKEEVQEAIKGADMVFIASGLGGGTGSGAAPVVARTAKENGCLTVAVVTKPFSFEGSQRMKIAEQAVEDLKQAVDALIIIPNDRLLQTVQKDVTAKNAFAICDNILIEAVEGISDLITTPGIINIDFADIRSVMENAGAALMGIGSASGDNRAEDAARAAISSPLLEISINGAKGVLFSIAGGDDLTMFEIQDAAKIITESVDPNAKIIFGTVRDDKLKKGELKITVIASNFPDNYPRKASSLFQNTFGADEERGKGRIFNALSQTPKETPKQVEEKKAESKPETKQTPKPPVDDNDDDWSAVPAFLRRSKLK
ncbi:MAG: cell division protein FtsZ [Candidatus Zambryskibacteria bacterium RIFCSPLOWO2_12_FULL_45_14]|uniref:Cell division protein FtsZ n=1 Tax=Candidatus Zambryskibacteria bacterium RIFCSPLOWO2_12_FULL_45_14 TaxID=1802778 RepID=A0A1G2UY25_9BACT|nr:MAG: cell division protein FtsZ [Candidatus Zambryskibacteria bacterium RIFCSPLOWO2_12_FULL_45_14]